MQLQMIWPQLLPNRKSIKNIKVYVMHFSKLQGRKCRQEIKITIFFTQNTHTYRHSAKFFWGWSSSFLTLGSKSFQKYFVIILNISYLDKLEGQRLHIIITIRTPRTRKEGTKRKYTPSPKRQETEESH